MAADSSLLFSTVPKEDYLALLQGGKPRYKKVLQFLQFRNQDVSRATGVPLASVRFDERIPAELVGRVTEWATLLNLVAQSFQGDADKTALWFTMPNPLLGNVAPRDMVRFGRYTKLLRFITSAMAENEP